MSPSPPPYTDPSPPAATFPGGRWLARLWGQLRRRNPFAGDCLPSRVPLFQPCRPTLPFPNLWNYRQPIEILETYFWGADSEPGPGRHNPYLDVPGFAPILVTRDPAVIRAITTDTGDREGQFDRDTLPSKGIARATGNDTLLYSNGSFWRAQRKLAASPFGKTALFQPEKFREFAATLRTTVAARIALLQRHIQQSGQSSVRIALEPEIKAVMLELLVNNFFGASIDYETLRGRYVPAIERVIDQIVRDTVANRLGLPLWRLPAVSRRMAEAQAAHARFAELTDLVLVPRKEGKGLWAQFKSDAPDAALRSNIMVFLAGALAATTSYATWAISHLARHPAVQQRVYEELHAITDYTPETLESARYFGSRLRCKIEL
jgi:cytochrome P450